MTRPMSLPAPTGTPYRIAFVCLGNICRSPMADVVLSQLVDEAGLATKVEVSSSGTGTWHLGEPMDPRAAGQLLRRGVRRLRAPGAEVRRRAGSSRTSCSPWTRRTSPRSATAGASSDRVRMFRSFDPLVDGSEDPADLDVPDPFYGGDEGFVEVIRIVERTCRRLLTELEALDL